MVMKENEKEIFIDEMADLGDEWTIEELKGTSYEKMSLISNPPWTIYNSP